ncbi:GpE family phage tail protein [Paraburkholderia bryophila]|jgi:Phage P2 GpE|nr:MULTISPECIES: GpE family phage tail protein [Burkholderiaceae]
MADIATVFSGWTPATMDAYYPAELMEWRERARLRSGTNNDG